MDTEEGSVRIDSNGGISVDSDEGAVNIDEG